ncbi:pyrophosphatase PpaX [Bacillus sp. HMF5848]|uniref:pyrophosphatase PpaX n=1 Tax=Bacillus sp. HMF5848 TaxID=2495421 RepID=UPI000F794192|nr:pyrophosphatase PpaX [Bacillus sp. HMF5848]RSK28568.1 pyrophosphatase PpaX [Bacillus sp. HMF5848]
MTYNTILFDLDGTLINTNELIIQSFEHTLKTYGFHDHSREDILQFIGPTLAQTFGKMNKEQAEEMIDTYRTFNISKHDELVEQYEGVFETVQALHEKGYKLGIVTSKQRTTVEMGLKLTKLDQFFDVVVTADDVVEPKPAAEPIEKALVALEAKASEAIMVGDNHHDVVSGQNAGVATVAVSWTLKGAEYLKQYNPDYLIDHMSELLKIVE